MTSTSIFEKSLKLIYPNHTYWIKQVILRRFLKGFKLHEKHNLSQFVRDQNFEGHTHEGISEPISIILGRKGFKTEKDNSDDYWVIKNSTWRDRHPLANDFRVGAITAGFSLIAGITLWQLETRKDYQKELQLQMRLNQISDSLKTFQIHIMDSAKHMTEENLSKPIDSAK
jgi:hypothetical protein